jgi:type VI secretion system protein ImpG
VHDVIISHKGLNQAVHLSPSCIQPVGFADDQGLLPYPAHSFLGYRLLTEYFSFPEKFLFCDFTELSAVFERGFTDEVQIHLLLSQAYPELEGLIDDNAMLLHCSPMINLFEQTGEPITVNQKQYEYHVIADAHRKKESIEIYSINSLKPLGQTELHCLPYFGRKYADSQEQACLYWHSKQKAAWELGAYHMPGNEVFVSFNAANGQLPDNLILSPQLLCTNRDLPSHLPFGGDNPQLQFWHNNSLVKQLRCVAPITKPKYRQRQVQYDRELISHITLNQIGFAEAEDTLNTLKEVLALYHYDDPHSQTAIQQGLVSAEIQYCTERHPTSLKYGFCQGIALTLTIDEKFFPQHIAYLFGSVLNAFFAKSCSINSFTKLTLSSQQRGVIHQWKPQFGHKATL